jgi:hypothetical protein
MSLRYRQEFSEAGDVLDPQVPNANQNELISEFNGGLDRDNFLNAAIAEAQIVDNAFTKLHYAAGNTAIPTSSTIRSWIPLTDNVLTLTFPQDCLIICEWGGTWAWLGGYTASDYIAEDAVAFRITLDGTDLCVSHWFGSSAEYNSTHILGATPVSAGTHVVQVEAFLSRIKHNNLQFSSDDMQAIVVVGARELVVEERRR